MLNFANRGGSGGGKKWHHNGRRTKKQNSIIDYISCAEFLVGEGIVQKNKLAGWGYSAGGLLVASAINIRPDLFRAAVLKVRVMGDPIHVITCLLDLFAPCIADDEQFYPACELCIWGTKITLTIKSGSGP